MHVSSHSPGDDVITHRPVTVRAACPYYWVRLSLSGGNNATHSSLALQGSCPEESGKRPGECRRHGSVSVLPYDARTLKLAQAGTHLPPRTFGTAIPVCTQPSNHTGADHGCIWLGGRQGSQASQQTDLTPSSPVALTQLPATLPLLFDAAQSFPTASNS
ncbi:hypothetical protein AAFF_G00341800 [Aldrovandia affinis]|uniref:Uncharacterized protein n=1 Tax=Aldrovandia affinis TaxID=143900 RepID=A0AAD7SLV5_9TELE|nr:hypothetical protein AAFF_G00341800 [Aldrovandia affinis]